ncbi:MAG: Hsp20/alpha crystallin family protein [Candidatus Brocadiae bacterium]|nr:Hsp20/alpha crystallin family protein [Candidatus Brocadiia bacterium]
MTNEMAKKNPAQEIERTHTTPVFNPSVDIYEKENELVFVVDMPGVTEKDVNIQFENWILTITGHVEPKPLEGHRLFYGEYKEGDYRRSFSIPEEIDVEKIEASVKNGVVSIVLPKSPKPQARKIPVKIS